MNLLLLTDFSASAFNALEYAVQFFETQPAHFHLVHICHPDDVQGGPNEDPTDLEMRILGQMDHLIKKIRQAYPDVEHQYEGICERQAFLPGVKGLIRDKDIDLIIMGQKGAGARQELNVGSHAYEVATRIKKPLLLIPNGIAFEKAGSLAFSTDYNFHFNSRLLDELALLQDLSNAQLRIVHPSRSGSGLSRTQQANKDHIATFVKDRFHSFHAVDCTNLAEGIREIARKFPIGLLLFPAKNVNFFESFATAKAEPWSLPLVLLHD